MLWLAPLWVFGLCGCNGIHFYSAKDHELAKTAKASFVDAKLPDLVKQEYVVNQQTLDHQITVVRRFSAAMRNAILAQALDNREDAGTNKAVQSWGYLETTISSRLSNMGALNSDGEPVTSISVDLSELARVQAHISEIEIALKTTSDTNFISSCKVLLTQYESDMTDLQNSLTNDLQQLDPSKPLAQLFAEIGAAENDRAAMKKNAAAWKNAYNEAKSAYVNAITNAETVVSGSESISILHAAEEVLKAYNLLQAQSPTNQGAANRSLSNSVVTLGKATEAATKPASRTLGTNLVALATKLTSNSNALEAFANAIRDGYKATSADGNPVAFAWILQKYIAQATKALDPKKLGGTNGVLADLGVYGEIEALGIQMDAVNKMVQAFVDNKGELPTTVDKQMEVEIKIARTLRSLADHYARTKAFPAAGALLLESERLRIELDAATLQSKRADTRIDLLKQKLAAMLREVDSLADAQQELASLKEMTNFAAVTDGKWNLHSTTIAEDYTTGGNDQKILIAKLLYYYANSWTLGRAVEDEVDYRLIGLTQDSALDATLTAVQQWNNLILVPLSSLEAYHASGITVDQFASLLNAAGLGAIAAQIK